jgi:thioredoxin 1
VRRIRKAKTLSRSCGGMDTCETSSNQLTNMIIELTKSEFETEVLGHSGDVLVDFFTPSCGPCRLMAPLLDEIAQEREGSLKIVKLDAGEHAQVAAQYRISAVPAFLLFRNGEVVKQRIGACSKKDLFTWIDAKN